MPSVVFPYDLEWAESLVGLLMAVLECWWLGYSSAKLCYGKIDSINKTAARDLNVFTLVLKDKSRKRYGMRYDTIVLYADKHDEKTCKFHLPLDPSADPARDRSVAFAHSSRTPVRRHMVRLPPDLPPLLPQTSLLYLLLLDVFTMTVD